MPMRMRFFVPLLITAASSVGVANAQSSATIGMFIRANVEVMLEGDANWRTAEMRVIKDCIRLRDPAAVSTEFFDFAQIKNIRTQKRGNPPGPWIEVPPVERGAMRGCARRNPI